MTGRLKWYYSRLRTMNMGEVLFRAGQVFQRVTEKMIPAVPAFKNVHVNKTGVEFSFTGVKSSNRFFIFERELLIDDSINFHLDIFSGKSFPLSFSKTIDMRTDRFGSAKVVWEVNRLNFLLPMLINYKATGDTKKLDLFVSIMTSWDKQNPYLKGINWYSNIEVNLRLMNWYWCWLLLENDTAWQQDEKYENFRNTTWLPLIYKHCCYSARNPSYFSSANNHLVSEYTGLFMASTLWEFPESQKWLKKTRAGLEKEIILQHSEQGVNKEEASGYIQFITDFFLLACIAADHRGIPFSEKYKDRLKAICFYINNILDMQGNHPRYGDEDDARVLLPDGDASVNNYISILNTAAVLFNKPELKRHGAAWDMKSHLLTTHINGLYAWNHLEPHDTPSGSAFYEKEGHFIMRKHSDNNKEIFCHFDAAPLGYLSIAAHGHADALSMILTIDGYPFLVDPGTYAFHTHSQWRKYFASTLAHNTVTINNTDQALLSGPTLWLEHYKSSILKAKTTPEFDSVSATHNGYQKNNISHTRTISFDKQKDFFTIVDGIHSAKSGYYVNIPFHLHPGVHVMQTTGNTYILGRKETSSVVELTFDQVIQTKVIQASDDTKLGWYSPSFMKKEKSVVIMGEHRSHKESLSLTTYIKIINRP
jgi:hypothetical protein